MREATVISVSKQASLFREVAVIANNVANANTNGFQREMVISTPLSVKDGKKYPNIDFANDI